MFCARGGGGASVDMLGSTAYRGAPWWATEVRVSKASCRSVLRVAVSFLLLHINTYFISYVKVCAKHGGLTIRHEPRTRSTSSRCDSEDQDPVASAPHSRIALLLRRRDAMDDGARGKLPLNVVSKVCD